MVRGQVVERRTLLAPELEEVGGAVGRTEDHARTGTLQQHVRYHGSPVNDGGYRRVTGQPSERALDALALIARRARYFPRAHLAVVGHRDEVGERSADVDAYRQPAHAADRETAAAPDALVGTGAEAGAAVSARTAQAITR